MKWSTSIHAFFLACALVQIVSEVHDLLSDLKNASFLQFPSAKVQKVEEYV